MELYDVVDARRKSLNYTKERGSAMNENEFNVGAEIWITCDNKILMDQRCELKSHPLMWETPGGCCQTNESTIDTIIRELKEEVSIMVSEEQFRLIGTILYKKQFVDVYTADLDINIEELKLQEEEVSDIKLVDELTFKQMQDNGEIVASVINRFYKIKEHLNIDWE